MAEAEQKSEGRKGDGYLIVVQDNATRQITIAELNDIVAQQLGYEAEELKGRKLEVVLGNRTASVLDEDLEYEDDAPDMGDLLSRQRELKLRMKSGGEITVPPTINRIMATDKNARFQLIVPNERDNRAKEQRKAFLKSSLDGHTELDPATKLPNRATGEAYLRLITHSTGDEAVSMGFAVLRLDRYEKSLTRYGANGVNQLLQHVAGICKNTFRSEDVVFGLGGPHLGLLLVDISRESMRVVLNRLRWNIRAQTIEFGGKSEFSSTVSIAFDILTRDNCETILKAGEDGIAKVTPDARNDLIELGN